MIPEHTKESLDRYVKDRIPTGDFLYAFLTNDLFGAIGSADDINIRHLLEIAEYIYNHIPSICWGSPEDVSNWLRTPESED